MRDVFLIDVESLFPHLESVGREVAIIKYIEELYMYRPTSLPVADIFLYFGKFGHYRISQDWNYKRYYHEKHTEGYEEKHSLEHLKHNAHNLGCYSCYSTGTEGIDLLADAFFSIIDFNDYSKRKYKNYYIVSDNLIMAQLLAYMPEHTFLYYKGACFGKADIERSFGMLPITHIKYAMALGGLFIDKELNLSGVIKDKFALRNVFEVMPDMDFSKVLDGKKIDKMYKNLLLIEIPTKLKVQDLQLHISFKPELESIRDGLKAFVSTKILTDAEFRRLYGLFTGKKH